MKELKKLNYGIVGLGIMGGSIAKAIRGGVLGESDSSGKIFACDKNRSSLVQAQDGGIIDAGFSSDCVAEMLSLCDFVFICLYPHATVEFLESNRNSFRPGAIVTDISGVKSLLESRIPQILPENADFILGHPMAGGEKEGYSNSAAGFFVNHNYILIPKSYNKEENLRLMRSLITAMGFSRITETDSETHDNKIGFTSQLCHVVASALVESAEDEQITVFAGGSFDDFTRIAMINAPLWTELFLSNREKLVAHIDTFRSHLDEMETYIKEENFSALENLLEDVRRKRLAMQVSRMSV